MLDDSAESEDLHFETGPHLPLSEQGELTALIQRFRHLFTGKRSPIQRTTITEHEIDAGDASPLHQHPYRHSPFERNIIDSQVTEMLRDEEIRVSYSQWSSPVVLVKNQTEVGVSASTSGD